MGQFVDRGFFPEDTLAVTPMGNGTILMKGTLDCLGDIRLDVEKLLTVVDGDGPSAIIQTTFYRYNASLPTGNILRYDGPHQDHSQLHHVHRFDVFNGDQFGNLDKCEWPTLGRVIGEIETWYYDNIQHLYPNFRLGETDGNDAC
ncbi:MAG TPA: hypothetical protein VHV78_02145 [Gemmatimonadaceae bacterium]|nr:hypothetical protein [Gemmatimonadaceae bacterium]